MKKIFALVCCAIAFFALTNKTPIYNLIDFSSGETYVILNEVPKEEDIIKVSSKQEFKTYENDFKGITQRIDGNKTKAYVLLNKLSAEIVEINTDGDFMEIIAYSEKIKQNKEIDGNKVNVQIIIKENQIVIGIPIIFDCY